MDRLELNKILRKGVLSLFIGKTVKYKDDYSSMASIISVCEDLGATHNDEFDSNGWQADCWDSVTFKGNRYEIEASGYYGGIEIKLDTKGDE